MTNFKAKMHQIRFRLGSAPDPAGGAYSAPPDSIAEFGGRGRGMGWAGEEEGKGRGREGGEVDGREREDPSNC